MSVILCEQLNIYKTVKLNLHVDITVYLVYMGKVTVLASLDISAFFHHSYFLLPLALSLAVFPLTSCLD